MVPAGTLVQGKLANGLALENRIRPLFVGNGFGNYADRLQRDDVRYILTYDLPRIGYESSRRIGLIQGILDRYPGRRDRHHLSTSTRRRTRSRGAHRQVSRRSPAHARD